MLLLLGRIPWSIVHDLALRPAATEFLNFSMPCGVRQIEASSSSSKRVLP